MQEHQVTQMAAIGQRRRDDRMPFVYLTDKYLTPQVVISGYISLKASDKVNDAGTVTLEVPADHPMVDVLIPPLAFDGDPNSALRKLTDIQQFLLLNMGIHATRISSTRSSTTVSAPTRLSRSVGPPSMK